MFIRARMTPTDSDGHVFIRARMTPTDPDGHVVIRARPDPDGTGWAYDAPAGKPEGTPEGRFPEVGFGTGPERRIFHACIESIKNEP